MRSFVKIKSTTYPGGGGGGGGGYSEIFIHTLAWVIFWVRSFEIQYFWGFSKKNISWGMKILWIFFGVTTK